MSGAPILTYHSLHAPGDCYAENDHIALEVDLLTIHQAGFAIVPLSEIAERLISEDRAWFEAGRKLGISFDDGCNHDFIDFEFPGNHSWDHLHSCLPFVCHTLGVRDDFSRVDNRLDGAIQIEQAERYIRRIIGEEHATGLFAYPDGRASDYLRREYFPQQHEICAAFGTPPGKVTGASDRWYLPRYVCGNHWTTPEGLAGLLT